MPQRRSPITPQFSFDDATLRYRGPDGRFVPRTTVRSAVDKYIDAKAERMRELAEALRSRAISLSEWQKAMEREIALTHLANAAAAKGGWHAMTSKDFGRVGQLVKAELGGLKNVHGGLRGFAREIEGGLPLDGRFLNRCIQYSQAGRHTFHVVDRLEAQARGMDEERSIRHASDSCFLPGTLVMTRNGQKKIEDICIGEQVLTRYGWRRVVRLFKNSVRGDLFQIECGHRKVVCTGNHPFLTESGWLRADRLRIGQKVVVAQNLSNEALGNVFVPNSHDDKATLGEIGVSGNVSFLLCKLTRVERLESWVSMPPPSIGFDDQIADFNVNDKLRLYRHMGFKIHAELFQNLKKADFQFAGIAFLKLCGTFKKFLNYVSTRLGILRQSFARTGQMGRVMLAHPLRINFKSKASPNTRSQGNPQSISASHNLLFRNLDFICNPLTAIFRIIGANKIIDFRCPSDGGSATTLVTKASMSSLCSSALGTNLSLHCRIASFAMNVMAKPTMLANWASFFVALFVFRYLRTAFGAIVAKSLSAVPTFRTGVPSVFLRLSNNHVSEVYHTVHNLEIEQHHEYVANGFVVHNCSECVALEALGWQPSGTVPLPGERICLRGCRCTMESRQGD